MKLSKLKAGKNRKGLLKEKNAAPAKADPGHREIFAKADGFYEIDDAGLEVKLGGSGTGESTAILDANAATGTWTSSNSAQVTVQTTTTQADLPLFPAITSAIKITRISGTTSYARYRFQMPASFKNRKLKIEWEQLAAGGFAAGDMRVEIFSTANADYSSLAEIGLEFDVSGDSDLYPITGKYTNYFEAHGSNSYYEMRIVCEAGTSALNIARLVVGPGIQPQGPVVGPWTSFTPTWAIASFSSQQAYYRRNGESMEIYFRGVYSSGANTPFQMTLPDSKTISSFVSTNGATTTATGGNVGIGKAYIAASGNYPLAVFASSSTQLAFKTDNALTSVQGNVPASWVAGDVLTFNATVPIAEWAGSGTLNVAQNDVEYASVGGTWDADSSTTIYGPSGSAMGGTLAAGRDKTITWQTPVQVTDRIIVWASKDRVQWFPIEGSQLGASNDAVVRSLNSAGSLLAGVVWRPGASVNQTIVRFARHMNMANDDAPVVEWPSSDAFWVVTKSKAGVPVGFGLATGSQSGLYKAGQAPGASGAAAIAAGYIGEVITTSSLGPTNLSGTTVVNLGSLVLTPGVWLINAGIESNSSASFVDRVGILASISAANNNSTGIAVNIAGLDKQYFNDNGGTDQVGATRLLFAHRVSTNTTIYLNAQGGVAGANSTMYGAIQAIRIA